MVGHRTWGTHEGVRLRNTVFEGYHQNTERIILVITPVEMRNEHGYKYMFNYKWYNCCMSVYGHGSYQQIGRRGRSSFIP